MTIRQLQTLTVKWKRAMGLSHWRILVRVSPACSPEDWAITQIDTLVPNKATITWHPDTLAESRSRIERVAVHELCHVLVKEIESQDEETNVKKLSEILYRFRGFLRAKRKTA